MATVSKAGLYQNATNFWVGAGVVSLLNKMLDFNR